MKAEVERSGAILIDWGPEAASFVTRVRAVAAPYDVPIVAICSPSESERVDALFMGADEALVWPFAPTLLRAHLLAYHRNVRRAGWRVDGDQGIGREDAPEQGSGDGTVPDAEEVVLGSGSHGHAYHDVLQWEPMALDRTARRFEVEGESVGLTALEYDLMDLFMANPGVCYSRDVILDTIWGIDYDTGTNIVDARIYSLRCQLRPYGLDHWIKTIRGSGYRFDPEE